MNANFTRIILSNTTSILNLVFGVLHIDINTMGQEYRIKLHKMGLNLKLMTHYAYTYNI